MQGKKRVIFLTGATGLIGSYLLKHLLNENSKVYALAQDRNNKNADERVKNLLNFWDPEISQISLNNLVVLKGDITKKDLGLNKKIKTLLQKEINEIFHNAAITEINRPLKEVRETNVNGTKMILELADECTRKGKLKKVNHLSTAYICGDYKGIFKESDLDVGQKFKSTYEQSKFESEHLIEEYRQKGLWIDIFRPSIVVGESTTGKIFGFRNIYQLMHLCKSEIFDTLPILDSYVSLVPIDFVVMAICKISVHAKKRNESYHIFPKRQISLTDIVDSASEIMRFKNPRKVSSADFNINKLTAVQKRILQNSIFGINYVVKLNSHHTVDVLKGYNFNMPEFSVENFSEILRCFIEDKTVLKKEV